MKPFLIIGLGRFLKENSVESVIATFSKYYHSVSSKYQKQSKLILIDKDYHHVLNQELSSQYRVLDNTVFLNLKDQKEVEKVYKEGSIMILLRNVNSSAIIKESFQYGLPVLGYSNHGHDNLLDASGGIKVRYESKHQGIDALAYRLRLLIYDPEVLKIMRKSTAKIYNSEISWFTSNQLAV